MPSIAAIRRSELHDRLEAVARVPLIQRPTPLQRCDRLSTALGDVRILMKREDLAGIALGGNKSRELEYFIGDAAAEGADVFIAGGGAGQSNHAVQCAAAARRAGMLPVLVLHRSRAEDVQGNLLLAHLVGADIHFVEQHNVDAAVTQRNALRDHMYTLADQYITEGRKPYVLESSFHPLGAIGFVDFALELNEQLESIDMRVDQVYLASAGATQAGLVLGLKFLRSAVEVVGISYTRSIGTDISDRVAALANQAAERLDIPTKLVSDDIINVSFAGEGYGVPSPESFEAIEIVAKTEGIFLDPVYTSKAMAGLAAHIKSGRIAPGSTIVFVHSGGTAALFAYQSELTGAGLI